MLSNQLKKCRVESGFSQTEMASKLNISRQAYNHYETGKRAPDFDSLALIADILGVSTDQLLGRENTLSRRKGVKIPVYGNVAAGIPIEAINDFDSDDPDAWEEITEEMAANGEYFALRIKGDSMSPMICDGDIVIVRHQEDVESGETAIVMVNGDDATCKRVVKQEHGIGLVANNPLYETRFFSNEDIINIPVRVLGKVVELRRSF